jgi:hypothetical protein
MEETGKMRTSGQRSVRRRIVPASDR